MSSTNVSIRVFLRISLSLLAFPIRSFALSLFSIRPCRPYYSQLSKIRAWFHPAFLNLVLVLTLLSVVMAVWSSMRFQMHFRMAFLFLGKISLGF